MLREGSATWTSAIRGPSVAQFHQGGSRPASAIVIRPDDNISREYLHRYLWQFDFLRDVSCSG